MNSTICRCFAALLALLLAGSAQAQWPTARANAARTGADAKPGPKTGRVLWFAQASEDYIASVTPGPNLVYVPALGAFNSGVFSAMAIDPAAAKRVVWSKTQPFLKLPTVCAPAIADGKVIFGDGMHQNSNPTLYCVDAASGASVWQLAVPGDLNHIEATPTVVDGKVFVGAGNAGVLCVDINTITLDGKAISAAEVQKIIQQKWKELQEKYEADKKKDPDFAIPPDEGSLPKPAPKILWQQGSAGKMHVDSPLAVAGDNVLAASSHLDQENSGDRALYCLAAGDGKTRWRTALNLNPWAGPTLADKLAIVGCSNIRFDPAEVKHGKGEVVAVNLADGNVKWRKEVAGGVLSSVAVAGKLAIYTATDKKVYAVDAETGNPVWEYAAKAPFFAGVAVTADAVYAADLNGNVHCLSLADGKLVWKLDVGRETKAPGNIFGSPVVAGGKLYVATCNIGAGGGAAKNVVVCIGEK